MTTYSGNLSIEMLESRVGIKLTNQVRSQLIKMRSNETFKLEPQKFHIFESPLAIVTYDKDTAIYIWGLLEPWFKDADRHNLVELGWINE